MGEIRLGYVGCGFMAQRVHIPNFVSIPDCRLVALAEIRGDIRKKVAERYAVPRTYASHLDMAENEKLDAVAISGASCVQGEMAIEFLKRGIPVFVEKPMATTVEQAKRIIAACEQGGTGLMVAYMKRYDAGNQLAREALRSFRDSGDLGPLAYVRAHAFCGDWIGGLDTPYDGSSEAYPPARIVVPDWMPENRTQGYLGYINDFTHNLNLARWMLDAGDNAHVKYVDLNSDGLGRNHCLGNRRSSHGLGDLRGKPFRLRRAYPGILPAWLGQELCSRIPPAQERAFGSGDLPIQAGFLDKQAYSYSGMVLGVQA